MGYRFRGADFVNLQGVHARIFTRALSFLFPYFRLCLIFALLSVFFFNTVRVGGEGGPRVGGPSCAVSTAYSTGPPLP